MGIQISFGGTTIKRPGAVSVVDSDSMTVVQIGAQKVLAVIGQLTDEDATVEPGTVAYFNNPKQAAEAVGDGDVLDVMMAAWRHGADLIAVSAVEVSEGSETPTDQQWQDAIDALDTEDIDAIIPVTTNSTIFAKVDEHVTRLSSVKNRRRRRAFYGHATGATVETIKSLAASIPTERGMLVTPCPLVADSSGAKTAKPGYLMAAAVAGLWASQPSQEPVTYKLVKFDGLEKIYSNAEIEELLEAHVAPVEYVRNVGFRIVQGVTLDSSADLSKNELSVSTIKDDISADLENYFETKYVGRAGTAGIERTIYNDLVSRIEGYKSMGWISGYNPDSVNVTREGTAFYLEWEGQPTLPINNFLIATHLTL